MMKMTNVLFSATCENKTFRRNLLQENESKERKSNEMNDEFTCKRNEMEYKLLKSSTVHYMTQTCGDRMRSAYVTQTSITEVKIKINKQSNNQLKNEKYEAMEGCWRRCLSKAAKKLLSGNYQSCPLNILKMSKIRTTRNFSRIMKRQKKVR